MEARPVPVEHGSGASGLREHELSAVGVSGEREMGAVGVIRCVGVVRQKNGWKVGGAGGEETRNAPSQIGFHGETVWVCGSVGAIPRRAADSERG